MLNIALMELAEQEFDDEGVNESSFPAQQAQQQQRHPHTQPRQQGGGSRSSGSP